MSWTPTPLRTVLYGSSSVQKLPAVLKDLVPSGPRALIITGNSLATKTPIIKAIESSVGKEAHAGTFTSIGAHAPIAGIKEATKLLADSKANILVSCGGGSPIDAGKAILNQYKKDTGADDVLPHIAIPTTLSAAEFTAVAGFTSEEGHKTGVSSPDLPPRIVILDPELSKHTPLRLWLSTGIRALDHAVESLYRTDNPSPIKHLSLAALADLFTYLPKCKANEDDLEVRDKLQQAAWMSLWPSLNPNPLGLSHVLGYALGSTYGIPHGICSCLTLAPSVRLLVEKRRIGDEELSWLGLAYDRLPSTFRKGNPSSDTDKALALSDAIAALIKQLDLMSTLAEYKVPQEDLEGIANKVVTALSRSVKIGVPEAGELKTELLAKL